ncbi:MAG: NAD(P)-dependent oxidoreductase, partial [Gammaproteobacteria bacterium]|nr:NAD(P)-dependent oxidoreductase [Gammaproteobacteria bacterium]
SWVFGAHGHNFLKTIVRLLQTRPSLDIVADQQGIPTAAKDLAHVGLALLKRRLNPGIYHYCSGEPTTWHGFAAYIKERVATKKDIECHELKPIKTVDYPTPAKRPLYSVLDTTKIQACGIQVRPWQKYADETVDTLLQEK